APGLPGPSAGPHAHGADPGGDARVSPHAGMGPGVYGLAASIPPRRAADPGAGRGRAPVGPHGWLSAGISDGEYLTGLGARDAGRRGSRGRRDAPGSRHLAGDRDGNSPTVLPRTPRRMVWES